MAIQTRLIEYTHNDVLLEGFLAWDDAQTEPRPAVAVAHAWGGRGDFECQKAIKMAELGYVGFAMDVYGKGVLGNSVEENMQLMTPLMENRTELLARINLGIATLQEQAEVDAAQTAAIGFCFGGLCVLDLARSGSTINAVASFHGLLHPPEKSLGDKIHAKVLCLHGFDDPMAPPENAVALGQELTAAGADWQLHNYGNTKHAFTNPSANDHDLGTVYNQLAEKRSLLSLQNFLEEVFS